MAVLVREKLISRFHTSGADPTIELRYTVSGTDDDLLALASLEATAPASYDGLTRVETRIEPIGEMLWEGRARYAEPRFNVPGDSIFRFETGGGTQHTTQSKQTISSYAPSGATPPDHKGAIGVTDDGVDGVDIVVPVYEFAETHYFDPGDVDQAYKATMASLTGKMNNVMFKGFAAGEVLFKGASGSRRGVAPNDDWEITFNFARSPNAFNLTIGDMTGIDKAGWDYLWVRYAPAADDENEIVQRPIAAYVERVYDFGDFSLLGI